MAAKAKLTVFALAVLFPIFTVCINLKVFWAASALLMVYFSVKSLKELVIVNFASDSFYEKYIRSTQKNLSAPFVLTDAILVCGAYALIMIMLFISFFMLPGFFMKAFSLLLICLWGFDFHKVFSKPSEDEEWSRMDSFKEIVMWIQGAGSVIFAAISIFIL